MVNRKAKRVEVLVYRYDGREFIVWFVNRPRKLGLNQSTGNCERMGGLEMKLARESKSYVRRKICPFVSPKFFILELN